MILGNRLLSGKNQYFSMKSSPTYHPEQCHTQHIGATLISYGAIDSIEQRTTHNLYRWDINIVSPGAP